jgi:hypothetical protein
MRCAPGSLMSILEVMGDGSTNEGYSQSIRSFGMQPITGIGVVAVVLI